MRSIVTINRHDAPDVGPIRSWDLPLLLALACLIYVVGTRFGIGIRPDSIYYLDIINHDGAAYQQAPFYPWLIALLASTGVHAIDVAWWLNLGLLVVNVSVIWYVISEATGSRSAASVGAGLVLLSPQFVWLQTTALSEPLFLTLSYVTMALVAKAVERGESRLWLLAAVLAGCATLTRFAGVPLVAASCLAILFLAQGTWPRRLGQAIMFGLLSILVFSSWLISSILSGGYGTGRAFEFLGNPTVDTFVDGFDRMSVILFPTMTPLPIARILTLSAIGLLTFLTWQHAFGHGTSADSDRTTAFAAFPTIVGLFLLVYVPFLVLSVMVEANLPISGRYLLLAYALAVPAAIIAGHNLLTRTGSGLRRPLLTSAAILLALLLTVNGVRTMVRLHEQFTDGHFYTSRAWVNSETIEAVRQIPSDVKIYSNGPGPIALHTGRFAHWVPERYERRTGRLKDTNKPLDVRMEKLRQDLLAEPSVVVYFDIIDWRFYMPTEEEFVEGLDLVPQQSTADGAIYRVRQADEGGSDDR